MTPEQRRAAIEAIEAQEVLIERRERNKLFTYYPDTGPLRRELYPKHMAFFAAGYTHRERCMMAGNRVGKCISGDTVIEGPHGKSAVKDIRGKHWVWSWYGPKRGRDAALAEEPFKKPAEMVYRVWLQDGQYVDCAAEHRFLGVAGWLFLSDLFGYVPGLPPSTPGYAQPASHEDVLHYRETVLGSRGDCRRGNHSYGARPQPAVGNGRVGPPSLAGAQQQNLASSYWGGPDDIDIYNHLLPSVLPSNPYEDVQIEVLSAECLGLVGDIGAQLLRYEPPSVSPPLSALASRPRLNIEASPRLDQSVSIVSPDGKPNSIIGYQPLGVQDIWDFHVPDTHNYCAAGMVHHNTEGAGGYETVIHLTGLYPKWWLGRRFAYPINALVAGDTGTTTRDILQRKICGPVEKPGTGLIPHANFGETVSKAGVAGAYDIVKVLHAPTGGWSTLQFRSYDQGRVAFQGTEREVVYLDEEPPKDVYDECLLRTMTTNGIVLCTFTPLLGLSDVALSFLPDLVPAL